MEKASDIYLENPKVSSRSLGSDRSHLSSSLIINVISGKALAFSGPSSSYLPNGDKNTYINSLVVRINLNRIIFRKKAEHCA